MGQRHDADSLLGTMAPSTRRRPQLLGELVDHAGEVGVRDEKRVHVLVVVVGFRLLQGRLAACPIMTNVERKIASSETIRVSVGHGLLSSTSIQNGKKAGVNVDEAHGAGEGRDLVGDPRRPCTQDSSRPLIRTFTPRGST
jgi:hypothetical protein